jgi:hypothetical protein
MRDKAVFNNTKITDVPEDFFGFGLVADRSLGMAGAGGSSPPQFFARLRRGAAGEAAPGNAVLGSPLNADCFTIWRCYNAG